MSLKIWGWDKKAKDHLESFPGPFAATAFAKKRRFLLIAGLVFVSGFLIPEVNRMPVQGATEKDWNQQSFWFAPWGKSGVHKGIDIFARKDTPVVSSTPGLVVYAGRYGIGGNVVAVIGPKWRLHYYAHLDAISVHPLRGVLPGTQLGYVGTSGNAAGKPPHLHYAILSLVPLPWNLTRQTQGWKRMFFINPGAVLAQTHR